MFHRSSSFKIFGLFLTIAALAIVMFPRLSSGQEYPAKSIEMVTPFPPGGFGPLLASLFIEEAKKYVPKPIVLVHKPGAAGTLGTSYVAKSPPDGYTLLMASSGPITCAPLIQKVDYVPLDFEMTAQIAAGALTLAVRADAPWKNLRDLINHARKNPEMITCGNAGTYGQPHLYAIRFEKTVGIKLTHVPFKGSGEGMPALAGGHISMVARFPGEAESLVDAGKLRILTVLDSKRCKFYPNVPSIKEEGYSMEAPAWRNLFAPQGTPKSVIAYWDNVIYKVTHDRAFIEKADKLKMSIEFKSAQELRKDIQQEIKDFAALIKELGLKPM